MANNHVVRLASLLGGQCYINLQSSETYSLFVTPCDHAEGGSQEIHHHPLHPYTIKATICFPTNPAGCFTNFTLNLTHGRSKAYMSREENQPSYLMLAPLGHCTGTLSEVPGIVLDFWHLYKTILSISFLLIPGFWLINAPVPIAYFGSIIKNKLPISFPTLS